MKKPQQEEIPRSIIKGSSGIISDDLNSLNGKGKILFMSPKCSVIGFKDLPYMLFATPEFNEESLPANIAKHIYEVKELVLQPTFLVKASKEINYSTIPKWLSNFKKIEYLRFEYVMLDDLDYLENLSIQHLVFENVKYNDGKRVISAIKRFKHLKEISYDQSVSADLRHSIKGLNLK